MGNRESQPAKEKAPEPGTANSRAYGEKNVRGDTVFSRFLVAGECGNAPPDPRATDALLSPGTALAGGGDDLGTGTEAPAATPGNFAVTVNGRSYDPAAGRE